MNLNNQLQMLLFVFIGGGLGSCCRYFLSMLLANMQWPFATLTANVLGSFLIGLLAPYFISRSLPPEYRLLVITGFLGGFTTFSSLAYESLDLYFNNTLVLAALNIFTNLTAGLIAAGLGIWLSAYIF